MTRLPGRGILVTTSLCAAGYVTDRGNAAVSVFDTAGECQMHWSSKKTGQGTLSRPGAISLAKDGSLFVSEHLCSRVSKFNVDGSWALTWGSEGRDEGMFREVGGIRLVVDGTVWVCDIYNCRAQYSKLSGEYLSQIYLPAGHPTDFMLDAQEHPSWSMAFNKSSVALITTETVSSISASAAVALGQSNSMSTAGWGL